MVVKQLCNSKNIASRDSFIRSLLLGSGEDGSGSKNDDNEPGDATDGGSGTTTKSAKENVAKEGGSGESGDAEIDIVVEKAPNRTTEKSNVSGKAKVQSAVGKEIEALKFQAVFF